jgi:hypothetical protein
MGNARWDATDWGTYAAAHVTGKPAAAVFTSRDLKDAYNPAKIVFRESRDSVMNPLSTPIILGSDVTGSMGMIAQTLMRDGLNTLATGIYDRKPVPDPHIMVLAIGDAEYDRAPLQATQFEADITLADQVRDLWIEMGGGATGGESYSAAHLFAALKTRTDAAEKRGRKGYLFTIGDEPNLDGMRADQIKRVFGETEARDLSARDCLAMAERDYEVFHIILANEGYARHGIDRVLATWKPLLPERTILLEDVSMLAETVISTIQVIEGASAADVVASWSGSTAVVVANALRGLPARSAGTGLRRL